LVILGLDPRIGQSTHSAEIALPGAARDARLKAGHDEIGDFGRARTLILMRMGRLAERCYPRVRSVTCRDSSPSSSAGEDLAISSMDVDIPGEERP
jgi:hypothetical protein